MIYEGNVTEDGIRNGWGITYHNAGKYIDIGWYQEGKCNGNMVSIDTSDYSINDKFTGWHENNIRKGELNDDVIKKTVDIYQVF